MTWGQTHELRIQANPGDSEGRAPSVLLVVLLLTLLLLLLVLMSVSVWVLARLLLLVFVFVLCVCVCVCVSWWCHPTIANTNDARSLGRPLVPGEVLFRTHQPYLNVAVRPTSWDHLCRSHPEVPLRPFSKDGEVQPRTPTRRPCFQAPPLLSQTLAKHEGPISTPAQACD